MSAVLASIALTAVAAAPITSLPGLATLPKWKMDSGYVSYASPTLKSQHHTFVWIAESQNDPKTDPIAFWSKRVVHRAPGGAPLRSVKKALSN